MFYEVRLLSSVVRRWETCIPLRPCVFHDFSPGGPKIDIHWESRITLVFSRRVGLPSVSEVAYSREKRER
jgi:hypothetical protein